MFPFSSCTYLQSERNKKKKIPHLLFALALHPGTVLNCFSFSGWGFPAAPSINPFFNLMDAHRICLKTHSRKNRFKSLKSFFYSSKTQRLVQSEVDFTELWQMDTQCLADTSWGQNRSGSPAGSDAFSRFSNREEKRPSEVLPSFYSVLLSQQWEEHPPPLPSGWMFSITSVCLWGT